MIARAIAEPRHEVCLDMLSALPPCEPAFYSNESNVISWTDTCKQQLSELELQYAFVAGSNEQYIAYFLRGDLPQRMWHWLKLHDVLAFAGFSMVPKKDSTQQSKLLMQCPANYLMIDPCTCSSYGLQGGLAVTRTQMSSSSWKLSVSTRTTRLPAFWSDFRWLDMSPRIPS